MVSGSEKDVLAALQNGLNTIKRSTDFSTRYAGEVAKALQLARDIAAELVIGQDGKLKAEGKPLTNMIEAFERLDNFMADVLPILRSLKAVMDALDEKARGYYKEPQRIGHWRKVQWSFLSGKQTLTPFSL